MHHVAAALGRAAVHLALEFAMHPVFAHAGTAPVVEELDVATDLVAKDVDRATIPLELDVAVDGVRVHGDVAADFELDVAAHSRVLQQRDGGALALDIAVDEYPARIELRTVAELDVAVDPDAGFKNASGVVGHPQVVDLAAAEADILADVHRALTRQLLRRGAERGRRDDERHGLGQDAGPATARGVGCSCRLQSG